MGGFAAARRTQSSFTTYLASTNPSAFTVSIYNAAVSSNAGPNQAPDITKAIAHLPHVHRVDVGVLLNAVPLAADGAPQLGSWPDLPWVRWRRWLSPWLRRFEDAVGTWPC